MWVETCTICIVYSNFAHTRLQKKKKQQQQKTKHSKQNAPSRYLEYANQGNLFKQLDPHKMTDRIRTFHSHWEVK